VRAALWNLITVAALNAAPQDASLALAAMVLRTAFVDGGRDGADIGVPVSPLDELHVAPAERYLTGRGARVLRGTPARALVRDDGGWRVHSDAGEFRADAVVLAVESAPAADLLPGGAVPDPSRLRGLGASPIVSVHVWFDRPVLAVPFVAAVGSPLSWIFAPASQRGPGQYLTIPVSAAHDWIDLPVASIRERVLPALAALLPGVRAARVVEVAVSRERAATFAQRPGTLPLRPPARTAAPGLVLAGAWTATGWPDTIEGAVRSGESAAAAVREHLARLPVTTGRRDSLRTLGTTTAIGRQA